MIVNQKYTVEACRREPLKSQFPGDRSAISGLRYYSPSTGRWLGRDPIDEAGGNGLYVFLRNASQGSIDAFGLKLEKYTDDVFALPLSPTEYSDPEVLGEQVAKVTFAFGKSTTVESDKCRTGYASNLSFTGKLNIELTHKKGIDPETVTGSDNLTVARHEREHAEISQDAWNEIVYDANRYEGCYCKNSCYKAAARVVAAYVSKAQAEYDFKNVKYDEAHYGKSYPIVKAQRAIAEETFRSAESELRAALQAFKDSECPMP